MKEQIGCNGLKTGESRHSMPHIEMPEGGLFIWIFTSFST
jgi:hypothetical protein